MKKQIGSKQKMMCALVLLTSLFFAEISSAAATLDLNGKNNKKSYNLELKGRHMVLKEIGNGESIVVYEAESVDLKSKEGQDEYTDGRVKLVYRKNGTATLSLNNGQNINVELSE